MKKTLNVTILIVVIVSLFGQSSLAQTDKDKSGVLSTAGVNLKLGPYFGVYRKPQGDKVYRLHADARVSEETENQFGSALSLVATLPFDGKGAYNLVLSLQLKDYKKLTSAGDDGFLNSDNPFGLGIAVFPLKNVRFLGISVIVNVGQQNRLHQDVIDTQFFPIASYPGADLHVGAAVPDSILAPYFYKEFTYSLNAGIILRL